MGSSCIKSKKSNKNNSNDPILDRSEENKRPRKAKKPKHPEVLNPASINEAEIIVLDGDPQDFPEFFTTNSNIGVWSYYLEVSESQFSESLNQLIESAYLTGKPQIEIEMEGSTFAIVFKDSLMYSGDSVYPVIRTSLSEQSYGWQADDGVIRPFIKELADILELTGGEIKCKVDGNSLSVNLPKRRIIELETSVKRKIILL